MKNKIKELINELNDASSKYYNGQESPLTDAEFDAKLKELKELEQKEKIIYSNSPSIKVGAPVLSELKKVQINGKPMLSLDKVHSAQEIINFDSSDDLIASIKCDGLSVRLIYENTDLISANTRGNGVEGGDITEHVKHFLNVPLKIAKNKRYVVDGEAVILNKDFEIINKNKEFKNSRNAASGALSLLDTSLVEKRRLSFIAWDIIEGASTNLYHYNLEEAEELGFITVPAAALDCTKIEEEEINNINEDLLSKAKIYYGIPCDGVVWRINNQNEYNKRGRTEHHFCGAVAWKPVDEEYETTLKDIEWTMGRTGILTPVAIYDDIEIDGSICNRASLHNISVMNETLGIPYKGQPIKIYRANMIIPQISWARPLEIVNDKDKGYKIIDEPSHCPICNKETIIKDNNGVKTLWCGNPNCEGKLLNRIDHYLCKKGLDVKGISKATIGKLIDWGWINELRDIYKLDGYRIEWISKAGFGEVSVGKILSAIDNARNVSLQSFISAIGIPLVGNTISKEIVKYYSTWEDFRNAVGGDWTEFEGFGPEISKAINNFDYTEADEIAEMLDFKQPESSSDDKSTKTAENLIFCITGKVNNWKNRDELKSYIESIGGKVTGSVTSKTNYLINNDSTSTSAKNVTAKKNGVPIITEAEFIEAFGQKK